MKQRIKKRILLNFLSLTAFTVILLTLVGLYFSKKATLNEFLISSKYLAAELLHNVNNVYKAAQNNTEVIAQNNVVLNNLQNPDKLKMELKKLKKILATYDDIAVLRPQGEVITSTDYNYTSGWKYSPFFINTLTSAKPQMSNAYYLPEPLRFITSFTAPVLDEQGKVKAIVLAQLNMEKVNSIVSHLKLGESGFASLIDAQNRFLYHPDQSKILKVITPQLKEHISNAKPIFGLTGKQSLIGHASTEDGLTIMILQDESEILADMHSIAYKVVMVSTGIAILVLLLGLKVSSSLTRPIETLNESIKRFSKGETHTQAPIMSDDEIGDLAKVFNDMTSEVNKFRGQLESLVEQRTSELREAKEAAEEANKATGAFLANMSHEIRTPMNAILGFSEILAIQETDEQNKIYLDSIRNSGKNLMTLINDVLDMSKIESGNFSLTPKEASISDAINDVIMMLENEASKNQNILSLKLPKDFPRTFMFDEIRLRQILTNLIGNAIKFTEKGSIEVIVECEFKDNSKKSASLEIKVKDSGIGISEEDSKSIFDNFIQAKNQGDKLYQGAGLGLAISQKLALLMNGRLSVESELNKGSVFTLYIPSIEVLMHDPDNDFYLSNSMLDMIQFEQNKVLLVDDNEDNLKYFLKALENKNLDLQTAENGQKALEQALLWKPELIIMDLKMPVMDGYESAKRISEKLPNYNPQIIACSASLMDKEENPNTQFFSSFLRKPVDSFMLVDELMNHLPYSYSNTEINTEK
ncbi:MAG: ATP-binding protein [Lentisphaerales bacterium]|nr:ATP-binding protein [Lentisphaerales bacterium]